MANSRWHLIPCGLSQVVDDLCWLFSWAACKTWCDLRDSYRLGIGISEDSITDMLLLEMRRRTDRLACIRYNRHEESRTGADWLWWFVSGNRGFPILLQAKRLFPSLRYENLKYKQSKKPQQIDTFLRYAHNKRWLPLFCFYNFPNTYDQSPFWGCTIASSGLVRDRLLLSGSRGNRVTNIMPFSIPWMRLVCPTGHYFPKEDLPFSVRRRAMEIPGTDSVPDVTDDLPSEVLTLLGRTSSANYEQQERPSFLAGIVVVSDLPIVENEPWREN